MMVSLFAALDADTCLGFKRNHLDSLLAVSCFFLIYCLVQQSQSSILVQHFSVISLQETSLLQSWDSLVSQHDIMYLFVLIRLSESENLVEGFGSMGRVVHVFVQLVHHVLVEVLAKVSHVVSDLLLHLKRQVLLDEVVSRHQLRKVVVVGHFQRLQLVSELVEQWHEFARVQFGCTQIQNVLGVLVAQTMQSIHQESVVVYGVFELGYLVFEAPH